MIRETVLCFFFVLLAGCGGRLAPIPDEAEIPDAAPAETLPVTCGRLATAPEGECRNDGGTFLHVYACTGDGVSPGPGCFPAFDGMIWCCP